MGAVFNILKRAVPALKYGMTKKVEDTPIRIRWWIHLDRTTGGHRHHCHSGGHDVSRVIPRQGQGQAGQLPQSPASAADGPADVCG